MSSALEGIGVLEISRVGVSAFATMILGDMGADVLKIEGLRDESAPYMGLSVSPFKKDGRKGRAYNAINRNKRSIALDLKSNQGREIINRLAAKTDVIIEGFRPGVVKRLGIDYESVAKKNPGIVYCSLSGYGQDGPYRDRIGHDACYLAMGGVLGVIGEPGGPPVLPLNLIGDWAAGSLQATIGILVALMARTQTGKGQYVDTSITDGVVSLLGPQLAPDYFRTGKIPERGEACNYGYPFIGVYETRDRKFVAITCMESWFWENFCRSLGREDLIPYQWATGKKRDEVRSSLGEIFKTRSRNEWSEFFEVKDISGSPVLEIDEVFSDPQVMHRQMVIEMEDPELGKVRQVGILPKLSDTPGKFRSFAPYLGEHTSEVLQSLGYSQQDIERLRTDKIVQ